MAAPEDVQSSSTGYALAWIIALAGVAALVSWSMWGH
jgi:hypothetical protein